MCSDWVKSSFDQGNKLLFKSMSDSGSPVRKERGYTVTDIAKSHIILLSLGLLSSPIKNNLDKLFSSKKIHPTLSEQKEFMKENPLKVGGSLLAIMLFSKKLLNIMDSRKQAIQKEEQCVK